jgi:predicted nucleotidyltransferase
VLVWPAREEVERALRHWAAAEGRRHPEQLAVGYFGSYARGDHGVGSDIDILVVVRDSARAFHERPLDWDATTLPVPADVVVYTETELRTLEASGTGFGRRLREETVWLTAPPAAPAESVRRR